MAELEPIPETFWDRWPVSAVGDLVKDGMVFHPIRGVRDVWAPHEFPFVFSGDQIRDCVLSADDLVFIRAESWRKEHGR